MRPTIPLGPWRIAVDLASTRAIDALDTFEARTCQCEDCRGWAIVHTNALPESILAELRRIGINPARPSDVYTHTGPPVSYRVTYHCVGQILSGPPMFEIEGGRHYEPISGEHGDLGLAVAYQERIGSIPEWATKAMQPLIAVDLWVHVADAASAGFR